MKLPYPIVCAVVGLAVGWIPVLVHGPIPYKFNIFRLDGGTLVWAFYTARLLIGFLVGITTWPPRWYLRGPLCGFLVMFPVSLVALATPGCGAQ